MKALIGKKIGMTQVFAENGESVVGTVLEVSDNVVAQYLKNNDAVTHIEIGKDKQKKALKSEEGKYKDLKFVPQHKVVLKVRDGQNVPELNSELKADIFAVGDNVEVVGVSKGKGFAGVVKRHGFKGGPRTHGASDRERAPGSIGNRTIPGRVYKGKRMAGHMGVERKTVKNLKILLVNANDNLIVVSGSVPGPRHSYVLIKQ